MEQVAAILVAAGASKRAGSDVPKQFLLLGGRPTFVLALRSLLPVCDEVVVVVPGGWIREAERLLAEARAARDERFGATEIRVVAGGERRQDSVACGLRALSPSVEIVLVHDAARPFAGPDLARRVVSAAREVGAAVPVVDVPDTVKRVECGAVVATLDRSVLGLAQTPQGFRRDVIEAAYRGLAVSITDDAQAVELAGIPVATVPGEPGNVKLTTPGDIEIAHLRVNAELGLDGAARVGIGHDLHRLAGGRRLVLCGVEIPFEKGLDGYSDADVALHALMDALLGAVGAGDIGALFPPGEPEFAGISSMELLRRVLDVVKSKGYAVGSVDVTVVAEAPQLAPFVGQMRAALASGLGVGVDAVSVKATTTEGLGPEGEGVAISAEAVAVVRPVSTGRQERQ